MKKRNAISLTLLIILFVFGMIAEVIGETPFTLNHIFLLTLTNTIILTTRGD